MAFWIQDIRNLLGITVLMVEHDMSLVSAVSDRVLALNYGRPIATGTPREVQEHPEVIKRLSGRLSAMAEPILDGQQRRDLLRPDHGDPRRHLRRARRAASSPSWAPTARARPPILKTISGVMDPQKGSVDVRGPRDPAAWTPTR